MSGIFAASLPFTECTCFIATPHWTFSVFTVIYGHVSSPLEEGKIRVNTPLCFTLVWVALPSTVHRSKEWRRGETDKVTQGQNYLLGYCKCNKNFPTWPIQLCNHLKSKLNRNSSIYLPFLCTLILIQLILLILLYIAIRRRHTVTVIHLS